MSKKQRLDWLDVSKAIGVYLVILGHLVIFNYHTFRFIFAFHMPFFFMAVGFVWKKTDSFKAFMKKSCKYYLVPYLVIIILGFIQCFLIPMTGHNRGTLLNPEIWKEFVYEGYPSYSYFSSAWFLIVMFWAQIFFYCMMKAGEKLKRYIMILLWMCLFCIAVFAKDIVRGIPYFYRLPLKMDSALMATVFIGIGYILRKIQLFIKEKWNLAVIYAVAGGIAVWLFGCKWNYYVNIFDLDYAKEYNYFLAAVGGTIMLFGLGQLLSKCKLLRFIGRNTLFIFLSHQLVCESVIYLARRMTDEYIRWQDMPLNGWSIGISIVTLVICTFLAWCYQKLKSLVKTFYGRKQK